MEVIVPLLVQLIAGGAGGNVLGQLSKSLDLGTIGNSVAGGVGGVAGTWLASLVPGLDSLVGGVPGTAASMDFGGLAGQGVTGLVGGVLLTALAGFIKSAMAKDRGLR